MKLTTGDAGEQTKDFKTIIVDENKFIPIFHALQQLSQLYNKDGCFFHRKSRDPSNYESFMTTLHDEKQQGIKLHHNRTFDHMTGEAEDCCPSTQLSRNGQFVRK